MKISATHTGCIIPPFGEKFSILSRRCDHVAKCTCTHTHPKIHMKTMHLELVTVVYLKSGKTETHGGKKKSCSDFNWRTLLPLGSFDTVGFLHFISSNSSIALLLIWFFFFFFCILHVGELFWCPCQEIVKNKKEASVPCWLMIQTF